MGFNFKDILCISKVTDIIDKAVTDKDAKNQIMGELEKVNLETEIKLQELFNQRMGTKLERCISVLFPFIGFIFGLYLLSNLVMYWIAFYKGIEPNYIVVTKELYQVIIVYLAGFFGKRAVDGYVGNK